MTSPSIADIGPGSLVNRRHALRTNPNKDMVLGQRHLDQMRPKVCQVLQEEE